MLKNRPIEIPPHRLETPEDITLAMEVNLLNLGRRRCKMMLAFAKKVEIKKTPAILQAKDCVVKDFSVIREEMRRESSLTYKEIARLTKIAHFHHIGEAIPWACELINHENNFDFINNYSHLKETLSTQSDTHPSGMLKTFIDFKRLLGQELLAFSQSKKTNKLVNIEELKKIIIAATLFDPANGDVLQALRSFVADPGKEVLYQNGMAELLFTRIPDFINGLIVIKSDVIRQKVFSRISSLGRLTARQKMALYAYFKLNVSPGELPGVLKKIAEVAQNINLADDVKKKLHNYLVSISGLVEKKHTIYPALFLTKELEDLKKLHRSGNVMQTKINYRENLLKMYLHTLTLSLYPTKDYFDLMRGGISDDCIGLGLAEQQIMVPRFFNIRIFCDKRWVGNIYMLDFTSENGTILIDRIQIPRYITTEYVNFFDDLKEALTEMFQDVDYKQIVTPLAISNHKSIQLIFNHIKDSLPKIELSHLPICSSSFESLKNNQIHYVLCNKDDVLKNGLDYR